MVFAALVGGLVGSRVDYLIQNWDKVSDDLLGNIFSGAGLVWFGGFVGGALGVILWARWRRWLGWELFDTAAVPLAVGYAIGRVGCQLSGDGDYGTQSDLPWAMAYPDGTVPTTDEVHPTPVYETLAMGVAGLVLWRLRDRVAPGVLFGLYLVIAGIERFLVEFIRRNEDVVVGSHPAAAHRPCNARARRRDPGHAPRRAAPRDGLSALPSAAAAQRASATVAPAALCAWNETSMPTTPASTATAAPPSIARRGRARVLPHGERGSDQHREHQQRAEPLDRHGHRGGEQHEQDEPHQGRAQARRRGAGGVEGHRRRAGGGGPRARRRPA